MSVRKLPARKVRFAVFVSGGGSNLQALLDQSGTTLQSGEVALVLADRPCAARERAEKAGVPFVEISAKGAEFAEQALLVLREFDIDLIILAGFLAILNVDFVKAYENRILNVHPSLIPAFAGAGFYGLRVHRAALARGVKLTGATVHLVNEVPDGGPILMQKAVDVHRGDTPEILQRRVMEEAEWIILPQAAERAAAAYLKGEALWS